MTQRAMKAQTGDDLYCAEDWSLQGDHKRDNIAASCEFTRPSPVDGQDPIKATLNAGCGINSDTSAYCAKFYGDSTYKKWVEDYSKMWDVEKTIKCHVEASYLLTNGLPLCAALTEDHIKKMKAFEAARMVAEDAENGWAKVADNPECISEMLAFQMKYKEYSGNNAAIFTIGASIAVSFFALF